MYITLTGSKIWVSVNPILSVQPNLHKIVVYLYITLITSKIWVSVSPISSVQPHLSYTKLLYTWILHWPGQRSGPVWVRFRLYNRSYHNPDRSIHVHHTDLGQSDLDCTTAVVIYHIVVYLHNTLTRSKIWVSVSPTLSVQPHLSYTRLLHTCVLHWPGQRSGWVWVRSCLYNGTYYWNTRNE